MDLGQSETRPGSSSSHPLDPGGFAPGTVLADRYRIVALVGRGGMGEVYRADDLRLGQPVALKFLPPTLEHDPAARDRLLAEVRSARTVSHPNVCRVYDVGDVGGRVFLTMEYIDGEDLASLLRRIGRLPAAKALEIARQLCAGLGAAHEKGVLHRDLKPANVMIDGRGQARITDFGLAVSPSTEGLPADFAGTVAYMAPERFHGAPATVQSDLYAVGLILYETYTGKTPFKAGSLKEWQHAHTNSTPTSPSAQVTDIEPAVERAILRCLEKNPARRPVSVAQVAAALPGGDPLAAALVAGETPSPELVAASGEEGTLPARIGIPLLLAMFALSALAAWFVGRQLYTAVVPFPYSAEVLATKAREMLGRLGYAETPTDSGFGFSTDTRYLNWLEKRDPSGTRWQQLVSVRPAVAQFWYRTSPKLFEPTQFFTGAAGVALGPNDPPLDTAGMTFVSLDLNGRLDHLEAVMPDREEPATAVAASDWPKLFAEAGLDLAAFHAVPPERKAPAGADDRAAWVGPRADANGADLRIEAASHRGRLMYFALSAPWTEPTADSDTAPADEPDQILILAIIVGVFCLSILLAIGHARSGRADKRGAMRVAFALGLAVLTSGVLESRWAFRFDLASSTLILVVSWAAFVGLMTWTFYAALEPYARRRWPQMLVSWNRLLDGRWRDPLVGRDLLVGSVIGAAMGLASESYKSLKMLPQIPIHATDTWMGAGRTFASLPGLTLEALWTTFGFLLLLVGCRIVLRKERLAMLAVIGIMTAGEVLRGQTAVGVGIQMVIMAALVLVATRFGLVALLAIIGPSQVVRYGVSLTPPAPLVGAMVIVGFVILAPAVFGFYTSRAPRSAASSRWFDE